MRVGCESITWPIVLRQASAILLLGVITSGLAIAQVSEGDSHTVALGTSSSAAPISIACMAVARESHRPRHRAAAREVHVAAVSDISSAMRAPCRASRRHRPCRARQEPCKTRGARDLPSSGSTES